MAEKIYCGNGRKVSGSEGTFRSVSICLSDIPREHITKSNKNGKFYARINVFDKSSKDDYGNDIYCTVNTWKPEPKEESKPVNEEQTNPSAEGDDLPF